MKRLAATLATTIAAAVPLSIAQPASGSGTPSIAKAESVVEAKVRQKYKKHIEEYESDVFVFCKQTQKLKSERRYRCDFSVSGDGFECGQYGTGCRKEGTARAWWYKTKPWAVLFT